MSGYALAITGYCLLGVALVALVVTSRQPGSRVPTGRRLLAAARAGRTGRVLLVLFWWWVGWHVFVR